MAGYTICSLDAGVFEQLTTAPTTEQCLALADFVRDGNLARRCPRPTHWWPTSRKHASRYSRHTPICALWEAAIAKDQKAFDKAMKEEMSYFFKKEEENAPNWTMWVSLHTSAVWMIAEKNGLAFPKLSLKQDAAVVRRQTVRLA
jgi:hypothetical protein